MTPVGIVEALLEGLGGVGALTYKRPAFLCHCSDERVYQALRLLQKEEVCVFRLFGVNAGLRGNAQTVGLLLPTLMMVLVARMLTLPEIMPMMLILVSMLLLYLLLWC